MNDITILPTELVRLLSTDLTRLDAGRLQEADVTLNYHIAMLRKARAQVDAALIKRYGSQIQDALRDSGRDFGTAHITDGNVSIKGEIPKRVKWNQAILAGIAERIVAAGDKPEHYLDIKLSVPESRYTNWPPALQEQFAAARTVEPGKPTFTLTNKED